MLFLGWLVHHGTTENEDQLISKGFLDFFQFFQKWSKNFCRSRLGQKLKFLSSFFGRIEDTKNKFWNKLTFTVSFEDGLFIFFHGQTNCKIIISVHCIVRTKSLIDIKVKKNSILALKCTLLSQIRLKTCTKMIFVPEQKHIFFVLGIYNFELKLVNCNNFS